MPVAYLKHMQHLDLDCKTSQPALLSSGYARAPALVATSLMSMIKAGHRWKTCPLSWLSSWMDLRFALPVCRGPSHSESHRCFQSQKKDTESPKIPRLHVICVSHWCLFINGNVLIYFHAKQLNDFCFAFAPKHKMVSACRHPCTTRACMGVCVVACSVHNYFCHLVSQLQSTFCIQDSRKLRKLCSCIAAVDESWKLLPTPLLPSSRCCCRRCCGHSWCFSSCNLVPRPPSIRNRPSNVFT